MKCAVLHVNTCRRDSNAPTMRIARFVADELECPLIHDEASAAQYAKAKFDVLLVMYGMLMFSAHRENALRIYGNARRIIRLENDYTFKVDSRFKKLRPMPEVWSTIPHSVAESGGRYINWNQLTYDFHYPQASWPRPHGVLYYGAYKEGHRDATLRKYFGAGVPYPVTISCTPRNAAKYRAINPDANVVARKFTYQEIGEYSLTVYVEDDYSHEMYCSLANRFYECLYLGVAMVFDPNCHNTLKEAGIYDVVNEYNWWAVTTNDVQRGLKRAQNIATVQRSHWHKNYVADLRRQLRKAVASL